MNPNNNPEVRALEVELGVRNLAAAEVSRTINQMQGPIQFAGDQQTVDRLQELTTQLDYEADVTEAYLMDKKREGGISIEEHIKQARINPVPPLSIGHLELAKLIRGDESRIHRKEIQPNNFKLLHSIVRFRDTK